MQIKYEAKGSIYIGLALFLFVSLTAGCTKTHEHETMEGTERPATYTNAEWPREEQRTTPAETTSTLNEQQSLDEQRNREITPYEQENKIEEQQNKATPADDEQNRATMEEESTVPTTTETR